MINVPEKDANVCLLELDDYKARLEKGEVVEGEGYVLTKNGKTLKVKKRFFGVVDGQVYFVCQLTLKSMLEEFKGKNLQVKKNYPPKKLELYRVGCYTDPKITH